MNQRRRPLMAPQGPRKPQGQPPRSGHYWDQNPYHPYWCWDDYDYWDYDYYDWNHDWDYYGGSMARPQPTPAPKAKSAPSLKIAPLLMINLLEYARKEAKTDAELQEMLTNMMNLSISSWGDELTMSDYETIIGQMGAKPTPPTPLPKGE